MTAMATTAAASMSRVVRLSDNNLSLTASPNHQCEDCRDRKEYAVHDTKRPRGLEHRTLLVGFEIDTRPTDCNARKVHCPRFRRRFGAICISNEAQDIYGTNKGANEAEVDDGDEQSISLCAVIGKEGRNGPDGT